MSEKKEIKCELCGKTFNITDLIIKTEEDTDIFLGLNWGIPRWKTYVIKKCPNCRCNLIVNNKKIEYQKKEVKK